MANRDGGIALGIPFASDGFIQIIFLLISVIVLFRLGKGAVQTMDNLEQEEIARPARVVGKRTSVSGGGGSGDHHFATSTAYFVTFEFDDGTRQELTVKGPEYGLLVEGDQGLLRSKGTWYRGFDRQV